MGRGDSAKALSLDAVERFSLDGILDIIPYGEALARLERYDQGLRQRRLSGEQITDDALISEIVALLHDPEIAEVASLGRAEPLAEMLVDQFVALRDVAMVGDGRQLDDYARPFLAAAGLRDKALKPEEIDCKAMRERLLYDARWAVRASLDHPEDEREEMLRTAKEVMLKAAQRAGRGISATMISEANRHLSRYSKLFVMNSITRVGSDYDIQMVELGLMWKRYLDTFGNTDPVRQISWPLATEFHQYVLDQVDVGNQLEELQVEMIAHLIAVFFPEAGAHLLLMPDAEKAQQALAPVYKIWARYPGTVGYVTDSFA